MPSVTFYHDGKPLNPSLWKVFPDGSVILTIDNVQPEDQGVYTIKLENEVILLINNSNKHSSNYQHLYNE